VISYWVRRTDLRSSPCGRDFQFKLATVAHIAGCVPRNQLLCVALVSSSPGHQERFPCDVVRDVTLKSARSTTTYSDRSGLRPDRFPRCKLLTAIIFVAAGLAPWICRFVPEASAIATVLRTRWLVSAGRGE
jgi:hypothetical protein